ncbi:MAG TPA: VWA domain-containing protein [Verrucomicrobiae bacterium]|nr:VWA domain-containing protein [Verrucomicrobiae bacterium]
MSFLAPAAALFALSLPVVVIFYLLKRKRVVKLVSSTLLWQRFLAETQANAPFQKLRHNWLLILQLLLLALVVLALMRPFFTGRAGESRLRVMVLDGSASMQATDVKPSRFEQARAEALKWVDGLRDNEQMMILLAGSGTEVKQSPTSDKAALRRALNSCVVSDSPTRLADALKTAGAFTFEKRGEETVTSGEIHLFSDGAAPDLSDVANKNLPVIYHQVGTAGQNAGITRLDARTNPEDPSQRAVFVSVANFATNAIRTDVELLFDGQLLETRPLDLAPSNTDLVVFKSPQTRNGIFTVRLTEADDLSVDNQASIVSLMPTPAKVLLVSKGNRFLEKAIKGSPGVQLTVAPQLTDAAEAFDLCVLDDSVPAVWPNVNILAFRTLATNWFNGWEVATNPPIVDWKTTHPVMRFVNLDNVYVAETRVVKTPPWGVALVESPQTPLVVAGEINRQRVVWVGFDPLQSTWPLRISFPIFMANAVDWLNPGSANNNQLLVQPGNAFRWSLSRPETAAELTTPDGQTQSLAIDPATRELVVNDTSRQGVYHVKVGTNEIVFCVNLLDAAESSIAARPDLPIGRYGNIAASTLKRANMELWRWIAAAGLLVLLFEWWWYHKRTA